jgi:hypothetical protein
MNRFLALAFLPLAIFGCTSEDDESDADDEDAGVYVAPPTAPTDATSWFKPALDTTWQWQLREPLNTSYDVAVYDIDLFDSNAQTISALHAAGRKVLCYFSGGSSEDWRPDIGLLTTTDKGKPLAGWAGENWLDVRSPTVLALAVQRMDLAVSKGCDGVEPDNMDGYANDSGFPLTAGDQLAFNRQIAAQAHARGLFVALKNEGGQAADLVSDFDLSLNEQCHELSECAQLAPFTAAGKPIFNAEYAASAADAQTLAATLCPKAKAAGTHTLILPLELDGTFRVSCE